MVKLFDSFFDFYYIQKLLTDFLSVVLIFISKISCFKDKQESTGATNKLIGFHKRLFQKGVFYILKDTPYSYFSVYFI